MKSILKIIFLILFLKGCNLIEKKLSSDKKIYDAIIRDDCSSGIIYDSTKFVLIYNKTITTDIQYLKSPIKEHISDSVFIKMQNDLNRNNLTEKKIKLKYFSSKYNIIIVDDSKINNFYQSNNSSFIENVWGIVKFSKPVYSKAYNLSFIYRVVNLSPLGGWGELIVLTHNENKWDIIYKVTIWVS